MSLLIGLLAIIISLFLILLVIVQKSKGGGLSGALGSANISSMIGTRVAGDQVQKLTWYFTAALMGICFIASLGKKETSKSTPNKESFEIQTGSWVPPVQEQPSNTMSFPGQPAN